MLCKDILDGLSKIQEMATDTREAFLIEPILLDGVLTWFGIASGIKAQFVGLSRYITHIDSELIGLDKVLPVGE